MRTKILLSIFLACSLFVPSIALARRGHSYKAPTYHAPKAYRTPRTPSYNRSRAVGVPRDSSGRIKRSSTARDQFKKQTGYPNGRPGYVIDHVVPLKRGGPDTPQNMNWMTIEDAKAKDKWE